MGKDDTPAFALLKDLVFGQSLNVAVDPLASWPTRRASARRIIIVPSTSLHPSSQLAAGTLTHAGERRPTGPGP